MKKIIVVDDDPAIQDALRLIFSPDDYDVIVYNDASRLLENTFVIPDLFILDKQLSGVDGLDLCRILKERPETKLIPVIILSASPNLARLANAAGADDFVEKPFRIKTLRESVKKQLEPAPEL